MTVFGDWPFKKVSKVKEVIQVGPNPTRLMFLSEDIRTETHRGKTRRQVSEETKPADLDL